MFCLNKLTKSRGNPDFLEKIEPIINIIENNI